MEPIERSNSPPIISMAAAMARMPSWAAGESTVIIPASVNMAGLAVRTKKIVTSARPATAPSSGRRIRRASGDIARSLSSRAAGAGRGALAAASAAVRLAVGMAYASRIRRASGMAAAPAAAMVRGCQRMPLAESSTTWAAFSLVTRFGPEGTLPPGIRPDSAFSARKATGR